jgi:RNA polymerase sigma factor (sigma-70 family)
MAVVISDRLLESSDRLLDAEPDEQLVSLVQAGHEAAFAAIVRRYERELQAQARRLTSDGRGEDAVQQAFLNAFTALQAAREVQHLRGWLHQILRNEVTRARVPIDVPLEAATAYGETLEDTVQRRATARATLAQLSALPDRQRDALLGTAVFGFPRAQVAHTMGLSEGAVRQLVHRARRRLRQAATALIPFPLVRYFGAARSSVDAAPDAALSAGAAASGGLVIKVGALLASGVVAGGIAVTHTFPLRHHAPSQARGARHHIAPARVPSTSAPSGAPSDPASATNSVRLREHGPAGVRENGRSQGGAARLSGTRSGSHGGPGSSPGRAGGRGQDGSPSGRGNGGSGGSESGTAGHGGNGSGSSSGTGSGSGSGSGSDGGGSGSGRSGSGSGSGHQSDSGSRSTSATGSSGSGSDDGVVSSDGGHGSGHSGGDGGSASSLDGNATTAATSGSSGSAPAIPATAGGDVTSGDDGGGSSGGGSSSAGSSDGGSGSGGQENSGGSRDLSGSLDSSSS